MRIRTEATIENMIDLWCVDRGRLLPGDVRRIVVEDTEVEMEAKLLYLPTRRVRELGLETAGMRRLPACLGGSGADLSSPVRLSILGRDRTMDVVEIPDDIPVLIGRLVLFQLDLVIDGESRALIGSPEHGGEQIHEMY